MVLDISHDTMLAYPVPEDLNFRGRGQGLENWSSRILDDKDFPRGQQHWCYLHPTQVNAPRLTPAMQAGTRFT